MVVGRTVVVDVATVGVVAIAPGGGWTARAVVWAGAVAVECAVLAPPAAV